MMNIAGFFSQFPGFVGALSLSVAAMASAAASAQTTKPTILLVHAPAAARFDDCRSVCDSGRQRRGSLRELKVLRVGICLGGTAGRGSPPGRHAATLRGAVPEG